MAKDDVTLYDIAPADQRRLAKLLGQHGVTLFVYAAASGFVVELGSSVQHESKRLARAISDGARELTGKTFAPLALPPAFERRVHKALVEQSSRLAITASDKEFTVDIEPASHSDRGGPAGHATDCDLEVALALAEEEFLGAAGDDDTAPTIGGRTMPSPEHEPETQAAETRAADTVVVDEESPPTMREPPLTLASSLKPNRKWPRKYVDELPDSHFLHVEPGGSKDSRGRSHPLALRHFPYKNSAGHPSYAHLVSALSRIPQSNVSATAKHRALAKAKRELDEAGYVTNDSTPRRLPSAPPRAGRPGGGATLGRFEVRRMVRDEEARRERDERPFDPARPRQHYARSHHFAVNPSDDQLLRDVMLGDTGYRLVTWDTNRPQDRGGTYIGYCFYEPGVEEPLFEGEDFGSSPMHSIDSDETLHSLLGFLTLRPGDTDREYFDSYTPRQLDWAKSEAEGLAEWGNDPDPEYPLEFVDAA